MFRGGTLLPASVFRTWHSPLAIKLVAFGKLALVQPSKGSTHTSMTNPPVAKLPIAPIFIADKVSLAVSRVAFKKFVRAFSNGPGHFAGIDAHVGAESLVFIPDLRGLSRFYFCND
jgi:hypothetical protein